MRRRHLVELEDLPWWPRVFRDAATDYLVTAIRHARVYDGHAPRLAAAVKRAGADRIIDLCSGGGGPSPGRNIFSQPIRLLRQKLESFRCGAQNSRQ